MVAFLMHKPTLLTVKRRSEMADFKVIETQEDFDAFGYVEGASPEEAEPF